MAMYKILELIGLNDSNQINIVPDNNKLNYQIDKMIPLLGVLDARRFQIMMCIIGGVQCNLAHPPKFDLICNSIGDPDSRQKALNQAEKFIQGFDLPVINHPENVRKTTKDSLWNLFGDRSDIIVPKTIRTSPRRLSEIDQIIESGEMNFPFLFEATNRNEDRSFLFVSSPEQMGELERFPFDGQDFYMTRHIDYRSADGLYRKYRFYVIGGKVYPGHLIVANHWLIQNDIQAKSTFTKIPDAIKGEEKGFLSLFRKKRIPVFDMIYESLKLDYFAIDCSFDQMTRPILFGVSSSKHYLSTEKEKGYYNKKIRNELNHAVQQMISKKLQKEKKNSG